MVRHPHLRLGLLDLDRRLPPRERRVDRERVALLVVRRALALEDLHDDRCGCRCVAMGRREGRGTVESVEKVMAVRERWVRQMCTVGGRSAAGRKGREARRGREEAARGRGDMLFRADRSGRVDSPRIGKWGSAAVEVGRMAWRRVARVRRLGDRHLLTVVNEWGRCRGMVDGLLWLLRMLWGRDG